MASSHRGVHSDMAKKEQIVTEFFAKSLHIILEARSPFVSSRNYSGDQIASSPSSSSSSSSSYRPRDKWFNLALQDCPAALENIDFWRQSNLEPMIIDVILVHRPLDQQSKNLFPEGLPIRDPTAKEKEEFRLEKRHEKVIERWVVQYENVKSRHNITGSKRSSMNLPVLYKKLLVLLRSLYSTVRLLPAYKLFRDIISSGQIQAFTLTHRLRSFIEPFTHTEEADMRQFGFTPVDSSCSRLSVSVAYQHSLSDLSSEPSTPMSPQIIPDYVGSPLTDLKRFPSLPVSQSSPSYSPSTRHPSWSYEVSRASLPSNLPSPFPTYQDSPPSVSRKRHPPPMSLPSHVPDAFQAKYGYAGFDDEWPSPAFSTSTSISPPTPLPRSNQLKSLSRCESAPVRLPSGTRPITPGSPAKICPPPCSPVRQKESCDVKNDGSSGTSASVAGKFDIGRAESERLLGAMLSFNSSPRVSFSRSSSRVDYDDSDFACPFVVDEDDETEPTDRLDSRDLKSQLDKPSDSGGGSALVRKSQDAAVGALVLMLNKAPPLHQCSSATSAASKPDSSCSAVQDSDGIFEETTASSNVVRAGQLMSKTTALALEELHGYRKMKESLLTQGSWSDHLSEKDKDSSSEATSGRSL